MYVLIAQVEKNTNYDVYIVQHVFFICNIALIILGATFIFCLPILITKSLSTIKKILLEFEKGNYRQDIDLEMYENKIDEEFIEIIKNMKNMQKAIINFDDLKRKLIIENRNRILAIMNNTDSGIIIVDVEGYIKYINENTINVFPSLEEGVNILEKNFSAETDKLKNYVSEVLSSNFTPEIQLFISSLKKHIYIKGVLINDDRSNESGTVIVINNLERKSKLNKKNEKDNL